MEFDKKMEHLSFKFWNLNNLNNRENNLET